MESNEKYILFHARLVMYYKEFNPVDDTSGQDAKGFGYYADHPSCILIISKNVQL
jgi:hypothetical protein